MSWDSKHLSKINRSLPSDRRLSGLIFIGLILIGCVALLDKGEIKSLDIFKSGYIPNYDSFTTWEIASMFWAFFFGLYYLSDMQQKKKQVHNFWIGIVVGLMSTFLPLITIWTILFHNVQLHIILDLVLILSYTIFDYRLSKVPGLKPLQNEITILEKLNNRDEYSENVYQQYLTEYNQINEDSKEYKLISYVLNYPLLLGYAIFTIWYFTKGNDLESNQYFVSGFNAAVFLIINSTFLVLQTGIVGKIFGVKLELDNEE